jgi:signal transduction histidine kinase
MKKAVGQMGGSTEAETEKEEGACFRVRLSRVEESPSEDLNS